MQIAFESGNSDSVIVCLLKIHFIEASTNPQMNWTITFSDFDGKSPHFIMFNLSVMMLRGRKL